MSAALAVVVPAHDEQQDLGACLAALAVAAGRVTCPVRTVVVLDACTDGSADVVARHPAVETVTLRARNVGLARRAGAHALADLPRDTLLASTDADSRVPPDWFVRLRECATHADLVLGTVVPDVGLRPILERRWYDRHDLGDGHPHVHGANLAIRADAYRALGGWSPVATGEDADLVHRAVLAGLRICRTGAAPVLTSVRAHGRAPRGFSSYLRALGHR